jgi:DUF1680 family protein
MTPSRTAGPVDAEKSPAAILKPLDARAVTIDGGVWASAQSVNRDAALPHGHRMLEAAGNFENLRIAAGRSNGRYRGPVFMDSDVYKWLEAAACEIARSPSPWLQSASADAIEQADHPHGHVADLEIDVAAPLESEWAPDRLEGVALVRGTGWQVDTKPWANRLYRPVGSPTAARRRTQLTAVPYYTWANRDPGAMRVWIPRGAASPS